ncbi:LEAF RUST 10 DISEASE-RESISTANCE LOCUS RECEPTOR-LIKE PROTEIN KINASE-like 2.4 [Cornus florida]|uniref:LEAF RUST 10 DISEASE-RESISTANCE LOCUS RECEPTOR-LIKE PROTEIN KINASE-like 2.4 n=1 Tax=Cornus florida TaxID=4283 RepID=UPI0028991ABA|nr:LEAF RUST 10 DISEASE-RESISTANCE LOCUS RECEPTOR-LIKE PROTEIN KINASE-like 2.4 [Cornus florida]
MKSLLFSFPPSPSLFFIFLVVVDLLPLSSSDANKWYTTCGTLFYCGKITAVDYPFRGSDQPETCGYPGLKLDCDDGVPNIVIMNVKYRILGINQNTKVLKIARKDFMEDICVDKFINTTLDSTLFEYASGYENVAFMYGCPPSDVPIPGQFTCPIDGVAYTDGHVRVGAQGPGACHASVVVPIPGRFIGEVLNLSRLSQVIRDGFEVRWKVDGTSCSECISSDGRCGYDRVLNQFSCFCPNQSTGSKTCNASLAREGSTQGASPTAPDFVYTLSKLTVVDV